MRLAVRASLVSLGLIMSCASAGAVAGDSTKELYTLYCSSCHAVKNAEAPEAFNAPIWKKRMSKGTDAVLANVIKGVGNMPPQGTCFECTQDDLRKLIRYMSSTP
jgi:cytochrome c5